jgi:AcrR family transcriptional regulator
MVYRRTERSERIRADSRGRILRAARKLFAREGYGATTMRDVAAAARTSIGNLYFYFRNKEELLLTLLAESRQAVWAWIDATAATLPPGPPELAVVALGNAAGLLATGRDLTEALLLQGAPSGITDRVVEAYRTRIQAALATGFPALSGVELELASTAWIGTNRMLLERRIRGELTQSALEVAEYGLRWNLRGMGVAEAEIDAAVAAARRLVTEAYPEVAERGG